MANWLVTLIATIITAGGSFAGVYLSNRKSQALMEYRIGELEKKMDKHNSIIERVFKIEGRMDEAEHDIRDLKSKTA